MARVIVVGSANVDLVWHGDRLPRPGETVTDGEYRQVLGGKGANQAAAAAQLGASSAFVGCTGDDEFGALIRADLQARGVDCSQLATATAGEATGVALITVARDGENAIAVAPGANRALTAAGVAHALETLVRSGDVVIVSLEITLAAATAALELGKLAGATTVLNPAPARAREDMAMAFAACDVVVPNAGEADAYGGAAAILAAGARAVVVTRGASGADIITPDREAPVHIAGFVVDAVDTTGAGDVFCAALATELGTGVPLADGTRFACAAAALACTALGARAALPTRPDVRALIDRNSPGN
jgi:ribokinase